jgi:hypothetical protein
MSQWTHISGMIRFDAFRPLMPVSRHDVFDLVGKSYHYNENYMEIPNPSRGPIVPMGSEGPIQYDVHENPDRHSLAAYDVGMWGDLRDFGEDEVLTQVTNWLVRITEFCKTPPETRGGPLLMLRALVVQTQVEFGNTHLFLLDADRNLQHTISADGRFWGEVVAREDRA